MLFYECIAVILRRNIPQIGPRGGQNRLCDGFMTSAWQTRPRYRNFVAASWLRWVRRRPFNRQIVTQSRRSPDVHCLSACSDSRHAMHARWPACDSPLRSAAETCFAQRDCNGDRIPQRIAPSLLDRPEVAMRPCRLDVAAGLPLRSKRFHASRQTAAFILSRLKRRIPFGRVNPPHQPRNHGFAWRNALPRGVRACACDRVGAGTGLDIALWTGGRGRRDAGV